MFPMIGSGMSQGSKKRLKEQAARLGPGTEGEPELSPQTETLLHAARSGQWMDAAEMRNWAVERLTASEVRKIIVDLSLLEHLDSSALQVLLAIAAELRIRRGGLELGHASGSIR